MDTFQWKGIAHVLRSIRRAVLEEAAKVCEQNAIEYDRADWPGDALQAKGSRECAQRIRDLIVPEEH